jgi:hypothetical protein
MRNDKVNGDRVMGKIKILGKWAWALSGESRIPSLAASTLSNL